MSLKKLKDIEFCALDLETTGVNPAYNRIVEIGVVKFSLNGETDRFHTLVDPEVKIPENVIKIHGITDRMVMGCPKIEDLLSDFSRFIEGSVLIIQNPRFDLSFIESIFRKNNINLKGLSALDTVRMAKKHFCCLPNHKLGTLAKHLDLEIQNHRALDDAIACMHVFIKILEDRNFGPDNLFRDLLDFHGEPVKPGIKIEKAKGFNLVPNISIGKEVMIKYIDSDGNITMRQILPKEFIRYGKKDYILAHCFLRDSERCFMTNRIIEAH